MKKILLLSLLIFQNSFTAVREFRPDDARAVLNFSKRFLPNNPIVVEAGAFNGLETKHMALLWPKGQIHAFEPVPEIYKWLKKTTHSLPNVFTYKLALGNNTGKTSFMPSVSKNNPYASGSVLKPKEHLNFATHVQFEKPIAVDMVTLDEWAKNRNINHVDILWLDMQGFELHTLMASKTILNTVKLIYTEVEFVEAYEGQYLYKDVKAFLESKGFKLIAKDFKDSEANNKNIKIGQRWYGNALFKKDK